MAFINGKEYTKQELLRYVGNISALAGVRSAQIISGKGDGVKIHEVTSGEVSFSLAESKNLDMMELKYKGMPLNFTSNVGSVVNRGNCDLHKFHFLYDNGGGMLYTAGYANVGSMFGEDETEPFHGRVRFQPAGNIKIISEWENDEYIVGVQGETREAGLFKQNYNATRKVTTKLGSKEINVSTTIENESYKEQPFMNLLHINCGFPLVEEGAKVYVAYREAEALNGEAEKDMETRFDVVAPDEKYSESLTMHYLACDENGETYAAVYNPKKELGLSISFKIEQYPKLILWKCMGPSDYVLGLLPSTSGLDGQEAERAAGTLRTLKPFEKAQMDVKLTILDGKDDFDAFMEKYNKCK